MITGAVHYRALAASHIAQQAAASRAERVLQEAVERAESAAARAQEAEEQAAEAAAHSTAHQDVASTQSQVSAKVDCRCYSITPSLFSHSHVPAMLDVRGLAVLGAYTHLLFVSQRSN